MQDAIVTLTRNASADDITRAIDYVGGMPRHLHPLLIEEIHTKTGHDKTQLGVRLSRAAERRAVTKYPRLRLATMLGVESGATIDDPLMPGDKITVRDAQMLGHAPIVSKVSGYMPAIDDYVTALVGDKDAAAYLLSVADIERLARKLENCDEVKHIPPRLLASANVEGFTDALKGRKDKDGQPIYSYPYLRVALAMNRRYVLVENGGEIVAFELETRTSYRLDTLRTKLGLEQELDDYAAAKDKTAYITRLDAWLGHTARAYFRGVAFAPNGLDGHGRPRNLDHQLNLWTGYAQPPAPDDDGSASWELLKRHIFEVLCSRNETAYEYLLSWMAHLFQRPWEKPGVAVVTWGDKRTGKGTVADALREAIGRDLSRMYVQKEHVTGRFATSAIPLMFNQIEEAVFARDPRSESPLKSRITDPTTLIELKFRTPYEVDSFERFWFNSNSEQAVPITFDEERYFVLHVSNERANDHVYFADIRKQLYHEGGLGAMVRELMQRDLAKFNIRKVPHTRARAAMVLSMLKPHERALVSILQTGELVKMDNNGERVVDITLNPEMPTWVDKDKVRLALTDAFREHNGKEASAEVIGKALTDAGIVDSTRKAHSQRGQAAAYRFRPLADARATFAAKHRLPEDLLSGEGDNTPMTVDERLYDAVAALARIGAEVDLGADAPDKWSEVRPLIEGLRVTVAGKGGVTDRGGTEAQTLH